VSSVPRAPGFEPSATVVNGVPISILPEAALPLTGAEIVPLVKDVDGVPTTVRATVDDVAAAASAAFIEGTAAAAVTGTVNDEATDISDASRLLLTLTGDTTLNGKTGGEDGKLLMIQNMDLVDTLTIEPEAAGSAAANRFAINGSLIVPPRCGALFMYDGTLQRWLKT
jgi:hypothetical protein